MAVPNIELPNRWTILLQSWLIQDGNYGEFSAAETVNFSLMFSSKQLLPVENDFPIGCYSTAEYCKYNVIANVVALTPQFWILDFGLWAVDWNPPSDLQIGQRLRGDILLSVDPFIIPERANHLMNASEHIYKWQVEQIEKESAPWVDSLDKDGRATRVRDNSRLRIETVTQTSAFRDEAFDSYILHCFRC